MPRLTGTSKQPLPPSSSRSPNTLSYTFSIATFTFETFVTVTEKLTGPPGSSIVVGSADFWTSMAPWPTGAGLRLVKVHFTVSPASSVNVAVRVPRAPVELASLHEIAVRIQPSVMASVDVYVPGRRFGTTI